MSPLNAFLVFCESIIFGHEDTVCLYILFPPFLIRVVTAEWCLPLEHLNRALGTVIELAQDYADRHKQYSLLPVYVRLVKTDDLFLSPANMFRPDGSSTSENNCYIEVRAHEGHTICIHVEL